MANIYEVSNVEEAVDLANKFKEEGKYNWFRGQVIDWPAHSSLFRRQNDNEKFEDAKFRYNVFIQWIQNINGLKYLLTPERTDELEAIMQHYGIPTDYIDFTTEPGVAGFFSSDTNTPPTEGRSCIYCLNIEDLLSVNDSLKDLDYRKGYEIKKVVIDVSNLWRLQAQRGVFLYANYNWDFDYNMDKIVFPYTGYPSYPTKDVIYPSHKDSLEILLDQFHDRLKTELFYRNFSHLFDNHPWEVFPNGFYSKAFINADIITCHNSWDDLNLESWNKYIVEGFHDTVGMGQKLNLNSNISAEEIKKSISYGILQILRFNATIRSKTIDWELIDVNPELSSKKISELLTKVWNGMRALPFSNEDISEACGNTLYLYVKSFDQDSVGKTQLQLFSEKFGESMKVGFANEEDYTGTYGCASYASIVGSYCLDLKSLVKEEFLDKAQQPFKLFTFIYNPRILFDFIKFKNFFSREVIPSQVAWDQSLVIYNPAKLNIFGIP